MRLPQYKERGTERQNNSRQAAAWERAAREGSRRKQHECETSTGTVKERNTDKFKNDNKSWQSLSAWVFFCFVTWLFLYKKGWRRTQHDLIAKWKICPHLELCWTLFLTRAYSYNYINTSRRNCVVEKTRHIVYLWFRSWQQTLRCNVNASTQRH